MIKEVKDLIDTNLNNHCIMDDEYVEIMDKAKEFILKRYNESKDKEVFVTNLQELTRHLRIVNRIAMELFRDKMSYKETQMLAVCTLIHDLGKLNYEKDGYIKDRHPQYTVEEILVGFKGDIMYDQMCEIVFQHSYKEADVTYRNKTRTEVLTSYLKDADTLSKINIWKVRPISYESNGAYHINYDDTTVKLIRNCHYLVNEESIEYMKDAFKKSLETLYFVDHNCK